MIYSSNQRFHHSFHFQFKEQGTHAVYGNIRLHHKCIDMQVTLADQYMYHSLFLFRQL